MKLQRYFHRLLALGFFGFSFSAHALDQASLEAGAAKGDAESQFLLGRAYANGDGVEKNLENARKFYRQAAEQGNYKAQTNLAALYYQGVGGKKDEAEAVKWLRKAAEQGIALPQNTLGVILEQSTSAVHDSKEAAKWYRKAAEQGIEEAGVRLGKLCFFGADDFEKNYPEAVFWLGQSAARGDAWSQNTMGFLYENGLGVKADGAEAAKWYEKAALQGDAKAQSNLGRLYYEGAKVKKDPARAFAWLRLADLADEATAMNLLPGFAKTLDPAQLAEGNRLVESYQKRIKASGH